MTADEGWDAGDGRAVRVATGGDATAVRTHLDAAMLTVPGDLADRVAAGDVLVAVDRNLGGDGGDWGGVVEGDEETGGDATGAGDGTDRDGGGDVVGVLVLNGSHVEAVAVRRSRRANGVATALVAAAANRTEGSLTATFRPQVRPFYDALGFDIDEVDPSDPDSGRLRGRLARDEEAGRKEEKSGSEGRRSGPK